MSCLLVVINSVTNNKNNKNKIIRKDTNDKAYTVEYKVIITHNKRTKKYLTKFFKENSFTFFRTMSDSHVHTLDK